MSAVWADPGSSSVFLVAKRRPLSEQPRLYRWLARWLYIRMHWCPDFGIEYQGVFTDEAEARYAASAPGMFYMELPLDSELPSEPCKFGKHDFPHSEASPFYRNRHCRFVAVPTRYVDRLHEVIDCSKGE